MIVTFVVTFVVTRNFFPKVLPACFTAAKAYGIRFILRLQ